LTAKSSKLIYLLQFRGPIEANAKKYKKFCEPLIQGHFICQLSFVIPRRYFIVLVGDEASGLRSYGKRADRKWQTIFAGWNNDYI